MAFSRFAPITLIIILVVLLAPAIVIAGGDLPASGLFAPPGDAPLLFYSASWLMPLGIALVAVGLSEPSHARDMVTALPLALLAALLGYTLCGYALQFGGVGLVSDAPELAHKIAEWSPLDPTLGPGWGLLGLGGFGFAPSEVSQTELLLFVSQLALVTTACLIPLASLHGRVYTLVGFFIALLVSAVCFPLVGNWTRGGGWLTHLDSTLGLGQGFVDRDWAALHLIGAGAALAGLLAFRRRGLQRPRQLDPQLPPAYLPLNVLIGAVLAVIGWFAVVLSQPLVKAGASPLTMGLSALWGLAGSALATLLYAWLVQGRPDPGLTGRGIVAALAALSAGLGLYAPWQAFLLGLLCGLLLAPAMYLVEHVLGLADRGAVLSVHGISAIVGLLAAGWLSRVEGASGALYAQLLGGGAILIVSFVVPWALLGMLAQAYELPATVREQAQERVEQARQRALKRRQLTSQGKRLSFWQRIRRWYLARDAARSRRLRQRPRLRPRPRPHT